MVKFDVMESTDLQQDSAEEQVSRPKILGQPLETLPQDLYIPPDALEVFLDAFEGPLDLLLYLIRKQNLDILNIPIAEITRQYVEYIELMQELHLELASEYLVMAATLAEIKSRMLLPKTQNEESEEEDPRAELIRRLQEYERFKQAANDLDALPRVERDIFVATAEMPDFQQVKPLPNLVMQDLVDAFKDVMQRAAMYSHHEVQRENLSIRERMTRILDNVQGGKFADFQSFFNVEEGRMGVVVTFVAILELLKQSMIEIVQTESYGKIYIKEAISCQI